MMDARDSTGAGFAGALLVLLAAFDLSWSNGATVPSVIVGLIGFAFVAATFVVHARNERRGARSAP